MAEQPSGGFREITPEEAFAIMRKNTIKRVLLCVALGCVILGVIAGFLVGSELKGKRLSEPVTVSVAEGSSTARIARDLKEQGLIGSAFGFRVYCRLTHADGTFQYGDFFFEKRTSYKEICRRLAEEGATAPSVTVVIPEGTGLNDYAKDVNGETVIVPGIMTLLERAGVCARDDFLAAMTALEASGQLPEGAAGQNTYYALEGYLYPDTYQFYYGDPVACAKLALEKMLAKGQAVFTDELRQKAAARSFNRHQVLTLASIVQMEAGNNPAEMKTVAAVFYNRLADGGSLGSSPTCYYDRSFPSGDGRYDTYRITGLPVGPLCSPGKDAILAVLEPAENCSYRYFVSDSDGRFYYATEYGEQLKTIERLKQSGKWIYEYLD